MNVVITLERGQACAGALVTLSAAQLASIDAQRAPVTPPVTPPSGGTVYPPEIAGRAKSQSPMPWVSGTRLNGPSLNASNVWIVNFRTGASSARVVRFQAVEREGGPLNRVAVLFRRSDGAVLARVQSVSITILALVGQPPTPFRTALDANTDYAVGIYNVNAGDVGAMFADLYL